MCLGERSLKRTFSWRWGLQPIEPQDTHCPTPECGKPMMRVMSLLQSAKMHGHDPWAHLKDILTRMPTQLNSRIGECHRQTLTNKRYR